MGNPSRSRGQRRLSKEQIEAREHRPKIGGAWNRIGPLQLEFMQSRGLEPHHKLIDVGCGALRGGVNYVRYMDVGNYYGVDIEPSLIEAGKWELEQEGLEDKGTNLLVSDSFKVEQFGETFDYGIAVSLFTHLDMNLIVTCLSRVGRVLEEDGEFYASFFEAPHSAHIEPRDRGNERLSYYDRDPYHYSFEEMGMLASLAGVGVQYIGHWGHRGQQMLKFYRS